MLFTSNGALSPQTIPSHTVGGFVLDQLGFIPKGGESFDFGNFRFSVVEMDGRRVARVKIQRVRSPESDSKVASPPKPCCNQQKVRKVRHKIRSRFAVAQDSSPEELPLSFGSTRRECKTGN
jgi:hypothetical protein